MKAGKLRDQFQDFYKGNDVLRKLFASWYYYLALKLREKGGPMYVAGKLYCRHLFFWHKGGGMDKRREFVTEIIIVRLLNKVHYKTTLSYEKGILLKKRATSNSMK